MWPLPTPLLIVFITFVSLLLVVDWYGVHVINQNGLAFKVHCYSYGSTFWVASVIASLFFLNKSPEKKLKVILFGFLVGAGWWFVSFELLYIFHGVIGGYY